MESKTMREFFQIRASRVSVSNTLVFAAVVIPCSLVLGLFLAYLLNKRTRAELRSAP
jgi:ABC-type sugar transport system permease subunit